MPYQSLAHSIRSILQQQNQRTAKPFKRFLLSEQEQEQVRRNGQNNNQKTAKKVSPGPWRPNEHINQNKNAHDYHRDQYDHLEIQRKSRNLKNYKQLQKGIVYQTPGGTWAGKRNGSGKRLYFDSQNQAISWVNGRIPDGGIRTFEKPSQFSRKKDDIDKMEDHSHKDVHINDHARENFYHKEHIPEKKDHIIYHDTTNSGVKHQQLDDDYKKDSTLHSEKSNDKLLNDSSLLYPGSQNSTEFHDNYFNFEQSAAKQFLGDEVKDGNPFRFGNDMRKLLENSSFPKHYVDTIERMMNTHTNKDGTQPPITSLLPDGVQGGAGKIQAQAGEILTMMATSLNDDDFKKFRDSLQVHVDKMGDNYGKRIVDPSWIHAMQENRIAVNTMLKNAGMKLPPEHNSWDVEQEVEALGMQDYKRNKGFSTDFYMSVHDKNGKRQLVQVSLKKDVNVNFLNSGTGQFDIMLLSAEEKKKLAETTHYQNELWERHGFTPTTTLAKIKEWKNNPKNKKHEQSKEFLKNYNKLEEDKPTPKNKKITIDKDGNQIDYNDISMEIFGKNLRELHMTYMNKNNNLEKAKKYWKKMFETHGDEFEAVTAKQADKKRKGGDWSEEVTDAHSVYSFYEGDLEKTHLDLDKGSKGKGSARITNKIMYNSAQYMGGSEYEDHLKSLNDLNDEYQNNSTNAIGYDKGLQEGMLREIRNNFPIQSVMEGEENMAIGHISFNSETSKHLFGVDNWDDVKESLTVKIGKDGPYLAHVANITEKETPLSNIVIRPDGKHYGGQMKFELKLHPGLAKKMDNSMAEMYGTTNLNVAKSLLGMGTDKAKQEKFLQQKRFKHYSAEAKKKILDKLEANKTIYENVSNYSYKSLAHIIKEVYIK